LGGVVMPLVASVARFFCVLLLGKRVLLVVDTIGLLLSTTFSYFATIRGLVIEEEIDYMVVEDDG